MVEQVIILTANPDKDDSNDKDYQLEPNLQDFYNLKEAIFLGEEELALFLIKKGALKFEINELDWKSFTGVIRYPKDTSEENLESEAFANELKKESIFKRKN